MLALHIITLYISSLFLALLCLHYLEVVEVQCAVEGEDADHGPGVSGKSLQTVQQCAAEHSQ